jgi:dethiobiotin synthetase
MTGHCNPRKHLHTMGIFKENPVCRLCNEEEGTIFHTVFECEVMAHRRFNLLGLINPGEEIPKKNLVNRLFDLIKGTNLFTQE